MDDQKRMQQLQRILKIFTGAVDLELVEEQLQFTGTGELISWLLECQLTSFKINAETRKLVIDATAPSSVDDALAEMEDRFRQWEEGTARPVKLSGLNREMYHGGKNRYR